MKATPNSYPFFVKLRVPYRKANGRLEIFDFKHFPKIKISLKLHHCIFLLAYLCREGEAKNEKLAYLDSIEHHANNVSREHTLSIFWTNRFTIVSQFAIIEGPTFVRVAERLPVKLYKLSDDVIDQFTKNLPCHSLFASLKLQF